MGSDMSAGIIKLTNKKIKYFPSHYISSGVADLHFHSPQHQLTLPDHGYVASVSCGIKLIVNCKHLMPFKLNKIYTVSVKWLISNPRECFFLSGVNCQDPFGKFQHSPKHPSWITGAQGESNKEKGREIYIKPSRNFRPSATYTTNNRCECDVIRRNSAKLSWQRPSDAIRRSWTSWTVV